MKLCKSCGTEKERREFHARKASRDGLAAKCRACQKAYDDNRSQDPVRVMAREAYAKTEQGRIKGDAAKRAYRKRNPLKVAAHNATNNAIRDKKLTKMPCECCGSTYKIHAHHDDYSKPLDVRWLCSHHHREWHRIYGEAANS